MFWDMEGLGLVARPDTFYHLQWTENESKSQQTSYRGINSVDFKMSKVPSHKTC